MPNIAVVILNWNGKTYLETFLPKMVAYSPEATIVLVDNHSNDNSVAWVQEHFSQVQLIVHAQNEGFCDGYNKALVQLSHEYVVLLNSDVEVTAHWLSPMLQLMEQQPNIAACQPKVKSYHQKSHFEYAGAAGGMLDYLGFPFCRGRLFATLEEDFGQYDNNQEIAWATGACMMVRRELYQKLGGLDGDFFAHMEEIDLCWRFANAGYSIYYCSESTVYHVGGGTLNKSNPTKTFLNFRNGLHLLYKNLPANRLVATILIRLCLDGLAGIKFFLAGEFKHTWAILRAHGAFYSTLSKLKTKRKLFGKTPTILPQSIYLKSIVVQYFFKGKKLYTDL